MQPHITSGLASRRPMAWAIMHVVLTNNNPVDALSDFLHLADAIQSRYANIAFQNRRIEIFTAVSGAVRSDRRR